jgi:hypothetical protein
MLLTAEDTQRARERFEERLRFEMGRHAALTKEEWQGVWAAAERAESRPVVKASGAGQGCSECRRRSLGRGACCGGLGAAGAAARKGSLPDGQDVGPGAQSA